MEGFFSTYYGREACPERSEESLSGTIVVSKLFQIGEMFFKSHERNLKSACCQINQTAKHCRTVFGTLTQFMGLRKINTIGIEQANKVMHLSAMA